MASPPWLPLLAAALIVPFVGRRLGSLLMLAAPAVAGLQLIVLSGTSEIVKELLIMSEGNDFYELIETGELIEHAPAPGRARRRITPRAQSFAILSNSCANLESGGQRKQNQRVINHRHVIANEHDRPSQMVQVIFAFYYRPPKHTNESKSNQVEKGDPQPGDRPSLRPARIRIGR